MDSMRSGSRSRRAGLRLGRSAAEARFLLGDFLAGFFFEGVGGMGFIVPRWVGICGIPPMSR